MAFSLQSLTSLNSVTILEFDDNHWLIEIQLLVEGSTGLLPGRSSRNSTFSSNLFEGVWFSDSSHSPSNLHHSLHPYNLSQLKNHHGAAHRSLVKNWRQSADDEQSKVDSWKREEGDHRDFNGSLGRGCCLDNHVKIWIWKWIV